MRTQLLPIVLAVLFAPSVSLAADPPIVYQTQPVARILDEVRAGANLIRGEKAIKEFNQEIRRALGDKGFDGFDINRPIVGYIDIPADPADSVVVLALPITGEKEFLGFCERWNKSQPKALKDGLYEVPSLEAPLKAVMRMVDGYAYIATGMKDPARLLTPANIVAAGKLYDPLDTALMTGRVFFDRLPKELRPKIASYIEQAKKSLANLPLPPDISDGAKKALEPFLKLAGRYLDLSEGAKEAVARLSTDAATGDVFMDFTLSAVPGSPLEKLIASRPASTSRFAGLFTADTVYGVSYQLPLFAEEIRTAATEGLELLQKQAANNAPPFGQGLIDELLKGVIRTVKTGDVELTGVVRGPDKNGAHTAVAAIAFEDPSGVEKELKKLIDLIAPQEIKDVFKWDADKAGAVSIHTIDIVKTPGGQNPEFIKGVFGPDAILAIAFAPKAVYAAFGPDAIAAVKAAIALKPTAAPAMEVVMNPARLAKLMHAIGANEALIETALGKENKRLSAGTLTIEGGKDLKIRLGFNVKLVGLAGGGVGVAVPPGEDK